MVVECGEDGCCDGVCPFEAACAHCGAPNRGLMVNGYATVGDRFVCHPDEGMDCYKLVTVHGHSMPCHCRFDTATTQVIAVLPFRHDLTDWRQE